MRKLMWFGIGFCAAFALCVYLLPAQLLLPAGLLLLVLGVVLLCLHKKGWMRIAAVICIGLSVGHLWYGVYDTVYLKPARKLDGEHVMLTLEAKDYSFDTDYGITVDGVTRIADRRYHVRMYVNQREPLSPGDTVTGEFRLRYTAPGGKEDPTHHSGNGTLLLAYPKGEHTVTHSEKLLLR